MRVTPGSLVQLMAAGHLVVAVVVYRREFVAVAREGLVGTVDGRGPRNEAFWYLCAAPMLWLAGRQLRAAEKIGDAGSQRQIGGVLTGVGVVGATAMPASPFWLVLASGVAAWRRAR